MADLDVIKDIPGYKVILKAVLKSQIQQLVEQLASSTDEESVILTASVADGTLSHLGSESGKGFLEDHEDIKSQFLGFCLKKHHRDKQERERKETEALLNQARQTAARNLSPRGPYPARSPRFSSPHGPGPVHPVILTRSPRGGRMMSPGNRLEPYPTIRPHRRLSTEPSPVGMNNDSGQIIKIEPDLEQGESDTISQETSQSPANQAPSSVKSESGEKEDDARSESSNSTIPNEPLPEGLGLDSDLSSVISGPSQIETNESGEIDPNVSVKMEAITESEMELEITGVEPGRTVMTQDNWDPNVSMGMNFDPSQGAMGNQGEMAAQGYMKNVYPLQLVVTDLEDIPITAEQKKAIMNDFAKQADMDNVTEQKLGRKQGLFRKLDRDKHAKEKERPEPEIVKKSPPWKSLVKLEPLVNMSDNVVEDTNRTDETGHLLRPQKDLGKEKQKSKKEIKKKHACDECGKKFEKRSKLERHLVVHTGEKKFFCEFCGNGFGFKESLKQHLKRIHKGGKVIVPPDRKKAKRCNICYKTFSVPIRLREHMVSHTLDKPFDCKICSKSFAYQTCLIRHNHQNHSPKKFCCEVCGKMFGILPYLKEHRKFVHKITEDPTETAAETPKVIEKSKKEMDISNIMEAAFVETYKEMDTDAEDTFEVLSVNDNTAVNDVAVMHQDTFEPFELKEADLALEEIKVEKLETTIGEAEGDVSILSNDNDKDVQSDENETRDKLASNMDKSVSASKRKHGCETCGKKFQSAWKLKRHLVTHDTRVYPCDICNNGFKYASTLRQHRKSIHNVDEDQIWPFADGIQKY